MPRPAQCRHHYSAARRARRSAGRRTCRSAGIPSAESQTERPATIPWARSRTCRAPPRGREPERWRPRRQRGSQAPTAPGPPDRPLASAARKRNQQHPPHILHTLRMPHILRPRPAQPAGPRPGTPAGAHRTASAGSRGRDSPREAGILPREGRLSPRSPRATGRPDRARRPRAPGLRQRERRRPHCRRPTPLRATARKSAAKRKRRTKRRTRPARKSAARTTGTARCRAASPGCGGRPSRSPSSARHQTSHPPPPGPVARSGRQASLRAKPRPTHGSRGRWSAVSGAPTRRDSFDRAPGKAPSANGRGQPTTSSDSSWKKTADSIIFVR